MPKLALTSKHRDAENLGIEVVTSSKIMQRGSKFNVHVSLENNFDKPIRVVGWSWQSIPGLVFSDESPGNKGQLELQPGDSRSLVFIIKANGVFDFTMNKQEGLRLPISKATMAQTGENLAAINIQYSKDGVEHWQEVRAVLNIYASPIEIYFGAIIGAIVGSFVRKPTLGLELLLSGILGFFLVLIAQRRTDVQLGISIEDWVGGAIIGFSVGYFGTSNFENLFKI
jgi:hypothetical protein